MVSEEKYGENPAKKGEGIFRDEEIHRQRKSPTLVQGRRTATSEQWQTNLALTLPLSLPAWEIQVLS